MKIIQVCYFLKTIKISNNSTKDARIVNTHSVNKLKYELLLRGMV